MLSDLSAVYPNLPAKIAAPLFPIEAAEIQANMGTDLLAV